MRWTRIRLEGGRSKGSGCVHARSKQTRSGCSRSQRSAPHITVVVGPLCSTPNSRGKIITIWKRASPSVSDGLTRLAASFTSWTTRRSISCAREDDLLANFLLEMRDGRHYFFNMNFLGLDEDTRSVALPVSRPVRQLSLQPIVPSPGDSYF
jgi:hypothetical protein